MIKNKLRAKFIGLATGLSAIIIGLSGGSALAWTYGLSGSGQCQSDGSFKITWMVDNTAENEALNITASSNTGVVPVGTQIAAHQTQDFTQTVDGTQAGNFSLSLTGNFASDQTLRTHDASVYLHHACVQPPTCPQSNMVTGTPIVISGSTASETFTVAAGCKDIQLSLVSYTAPSATFDENTADQQVVYDSNTNYYDAGSHTVTVNLPSCYYQADFVYGAVISHLGPAGTNNFYGSQGRLIESSNGGTSACGGKGGGPTGGTPTTTTTSSSTPQVLAASTTSQVAVVPQGSVNGGEGGASKTSNPAALVGLFGSLAGLGSGLSILKRRKL